MSNHLIHRIGDVFVSNRAARALILAIAMAATGAGVFALSHGTAPLPSARATSDARAQPATAIPVLPTVVVEAQAPTPVLPTVVVQADAIPTLPTVTVTARRVARIARTDQRRGDEPLLVAERDLGMLASGSTSGHAYDMPYYSFGKTLRRVNKE